MLRRVGFTGASPRLPHRRQSLPRRLFATESSGPGNAAKRSQPVNQYAVLSAAAVLLAGAGYWATKTTATAIDTRSTLPLDQVAPIQHNGARKDILAVWDKLVEIVGTDNITDMDGDLELHSTSSWSTHRWDPTHKPCCVVFPASTEEVSQIMKVCHARRIPVTGYSGGTSLEGHYSPTRGGISIDFSRMNKVLELHEKDLDVVVQPAVGWQALNQQLAEVNLFFPPDPGPGACIGGMVGTGCSGTNAYRYGTMRDWVVNLTVVLADGTIIKTRRRPRKSSAGYNLTQLFIGSEGTLGLVTEATLKLTPLPQSTSVAVCSFGTVKEAAECVAGVVGRGLPLAAIEILDDQQMKFINKFRGSKARQWNEAPTLFLKFGGTPSAVQEQLSMVKSIANSTGSLTFDLARNKAEEAELWSARKDALWATMNEMEEGDEILSGDVAVPISRLPEAIAEAQKNMSQLGMVGSIVGHVGDGNFHTILITNEANRAKAKEFGKRMVDHALEMDGTCTGEHGVGLAKRDSVLRELGEDTVAAMRRIKQAYDPLCLLNCDKIFYAQEASSDKK